MTKDIYDRIDELKTRHFTAALDALWNTRKITEIQRDMLCAQYRAPNYTITASQLARAVHVKEGYKAVNLHYGRLAHRLWQQLRLPSRGLPSRSRARWIGVLEPEWSRGTGGHWKGKMHPSLVEALKQIGWCGNAGSDLPEHLLSPAGGGFGDPEQNARVERGAVDAVTKHYQSHGWRVASKEEEKNLGYDLLCRRRSDEHHVEVKGVRGTLRSVVMTKSEKKRAEHDRAFRLIAVTNALDAKTRRLQEFTGPEFLRQFHLAPIAFVAALR